MQETKNQENTAGKFYLPRLPYPVDGLAPYIDAETIQVHHFVLHQKYVDNLNKALEGYPQYADWTLVELIENVEELPEEIQTPVFRNAGGVLNHDYYFDMMRPPQSGAPASAGPGGKLGEAIKQEYGRFDSFKEKFKAAAMDVFGSGWTWLTADAEGSLLILNTANQITPYTYDKKPIIPIDIWEHAYFLQYKAARSDYIDAWFAVADWRKAEIMYDGECLPSGR